MPQRVMGIETSMIESYQHLRTRLLEDIDYGPSIHVTETEGLHIDCCARVDLHVRLIMS